jgi:electron transport complex protein RnfB
MRPLPALVTKEPSLIKAQKYARAQQAKRRYDAHCLRKEKENTEKKERAQQKRAELVKMKSAR